MTITRRRYHCAICKGADQRTSYQPTNTYGKMLVITGLRVWVCHGCCAAAIEQAVHRAMPVINGPVTAGMGEC